MGLLLERLPRNANVVVLSWLGMQDQYPTTGLMDAFCSTLGYQAFREPSPSPLALRSLTRRFTPESWRNALSHHVPGRVQERLLTSQFRDGTIWQETTAFAIPSLYTGFLRVNLRGREPQGVVRPGVEYRALLDRLETDLQELVDPRTGQPVVERVVRTAEDWFASSPPDSLPDLFVHWKPCSRFLERVVHPRAELVQLRPGYFRSSYHAYRGFVAAAGPSIHGRGTMDGVRLLDLAPTFLTLLGEPVPATMSGQPIEHLTRSSVLG